MREILASQYHAAPDGLSGNEDCGQMSAWYVWSALGLYPENPVGGVYVIGSPLFEEASIDVGGGRRFRIEAPGASEQRRYVRSATLNGRPWPLTYLRHEDLMAGGTLHLEMAATPSGDWGRRPETRPPSASDPETVRAARAALEHAWRDGTSPDQVADRDMQERRYLRAVDGLPTDTAFARQVRAALSHAWDGYMEYARGHDDLRPLSRSYHDWHDVPLLMTPVDGFDTFVLAGLGDEAGEAKELILDGLSFDLDLTVQVFEITIRQLGGLLSAYQLDGDPRFLAQARDLADRLMPAFDTPTGIPWVRVNLQTGDKREPVNNPAEVGTLLLEFGTLSRITGDPSYYEVAKRAIRAVFERRSDIGLVGTQLDAETGEWTNRSSHVGGRIDSYYEYLLKGWILFGDEDLKDMWETSIAAVNRYVADDVDGRLWYGRVDMDTGERTATRFGALEAFLPGVLALGGDLERAERLMESVYSMWTTFDVEPEQLDYSTMEITSPGYILRPEALESAYILFVLTGDERWRDMGRDIFQRIDRYTRYDVGYTHLADVRTKERSDGMQSFFLAETLKYAYLLADPGALDYDAIVFNTEAHPLRPVGGTEEP